MFILKATHHVGNLIQIQNVLMDTELGKNLQICTSTHCNIYGTTPSKGLETIFGDVFLILKCTPLENFFYHINNLHQNIKFTMKEESNGELAFLDTLLKQNNENICIGMQEAYTYLTIPTLQLEPPNKLQGKCYSPTV